MKTWYMYYNNTVISIAKKLIPNLYILADMAYLMSNFHDFHEDQIS